MWRSLELRYRRDILRFCLECVSLPAEVVGAEIQERYFTFLFGVCVFACGGRWSSNTRKMKTRCFRAVSIALFLVMVAVILLQRNSGSFIRQRWDSRQTMIDREDPTLYIDVSLARQLQKKVRVMCWVSALPNWLNSRIKAINETWLPRCEGHIFYMNIDNNAEASNLTSFPDVVSTSVKEGHTNLTGKVVESLFHLYKHYLNDYDWFLKADADTYIVMENLRYLLQGLHPDSPIQLGQLNVKGPKQGFLWGGAGVVMSRSALKQVIEDGYQKRKKGCPISGPYDDVDLGRCLEAVGVPPYDTYDKFGRASFHPHNPQVHITNYQSNLKVVRFKELPGRDCCSQLNIGFHHISPQQIRTTHHLLYRTNVYGRVPDFSALGSDFFKPVIIPPPVKPAQTPAQKQNPKQAHQKPKSSPKTNPKSAPKLAPKPAPKIAKKTIKKKN